MVNYEALGFFVTKTFLLDGNTGVQLAVTNPKQRMDKKERLNGYIYIYNDPGGQLLLGGGHTQKISQDLTVFRSDCQMSQPSSDAWT